VRGCHNCSDGLVDPTAIAINEVLSGARSAFTGTGPDRRSTSSMKARQQRGDVMNQAASWQPSYQNEPCHSLRQNGRSTSVIGPASRRSALPSRAMRPSARSSSPLPASKNPHSARDSCTQQARRLSPSPRAGSERSREERRFLSAPTQIPAGAANAQGPPPWTRNCLSAHGRRKCGGRRRRSATVSFLVHVPAKS